MRLWFWIEEKIWNNIFDYEKRKEIKGEAKIYINDLVFDRLESVSQWNNIVFELLDKWILKSFRWLNNFVCDLDKKILVVDNHNYIVLWWLVEKIKVYLENVELFIHIDQHSDMKDCKVNLSDLEDIFYKTNVWNYIKPLVQFWLIKKVIQVRTEYSLFNIVDQLNWKKFILNIDLDFWHKDMGMSIKTIDIVKKLISKSVFSFVSFSPYFIDFDEAYAVFKFMFNF